MEFLHCCALILLFAAASVAAWEIQHGCLEPANPFKVEMSSPRKTLSGRAQETYLRQRTQLLTQAPMFYVRRRTPCYPTETKNYRNHRAQPTMVSTMLSPDADQYYRTTTYIKNEFAMKAV